MPVLYLIQRLRADEVKACKGTAVLLLAGGLAILFLVPAFFALDDHALGIVYYCASVWALACTCMYAAAAMIARRLAMYPGLLGHEHAYSDAGIMGFWLLVCVTGALSLAPVMFKLDERVRLVLQFSNLVVALVIVCTYVMVRIYCHAPSLPGAGMS